MFEIIAKFESTKIEAKEESRDLAKVCSRKLLFISFSYHLWGEFLFNFFTNLFDIDRARKVTMWQEFVHFDSTRKGLTSLFGSLLLPTETVIGDCARDLFAKWFMIGIPNVNMLWFNFEGSAWIWRSGRCWRCPTSFEWPTILPKSWNPALGSMARPSWSARSRRDR